MQKDSESSPITDNNFYFQNWANYTPEHATIDLIYPTPGFITRAKNKAGLVGAYRNTGSTRLRVANGHYRVSVRKK